MECPKCGGPVSKTSWRPKPGKPQSTRMFACDYPACDGLRFVTFSPGGLEREAAEIQADAESVYQEHTDYMNTRRQDIKKVVKA